MQTKSIQSYLDDHALSGELKSIANKVFNKQRITVDEGVFLYENAELGFLGAMANFVREEKNGNKTFFNRNFHIEPTNICVFTCKFCSYSRLLRQKEEGWELKNVYIRLSAEEVKNVLVNGSGPMPGNLVPEEKLDEMVEWVLSLE